MLMLQSDNDGTEITGKILQLYKNNRQESITMVGLEW